MIAIDTDVLLLAYAYQRDPRREANDRFLRRVRETGAILPVYALMELLGQLSFSLSPERLTDWRIWLQDYYRLTIALPDAVAEGSGASFRDEIIERPLARMLHHRTAYLDALIIDLAERVPGVESFVTWNARHFIGKTSLDVLTPEEHLAAGD